MPDRGAGRSISAMTLTATSRAVPGTLRQEITVRDRFTVRTDEPVDLGGTDDAPSPHELVPAALAACVGTTLTMYARTKGWELGDLVVEAVYEHKSVPRRCELTIRVGAPLASEQLARLEQIAAKCPVLRAIEGGIELSERVVPAAEPRRRVSA